MDRSEGTVSEETGQMAGDPAGAPRIPLPPWDMYTVFAGLVSGYLLIPILVSNLLQIAYPFISPSEQIWTEQIATIVTWLCIFVFLGWRYRLNIWHYLGLQMNRPARYYFWESLLVLVVLIALILVFNLLNRALGAVPEQPYEKFSTSEIKVITVFAVLSAPILEELIFRGLVQGTFHKITTPLRTVLSTCLVFLLVHGHYLAKPQAMTYVFLVALVLGYWRERTQSTLPGMLGHLFNNTLASLVLLRG